MPTQKQLQAASLYGGLMEEIKLRITAIDAGTSGLTTLLPHFVGEFCFLQIRMICELIALGCLTAHGDITATQSRKLRQEWAADKIMEELGKLHPDFFPVPVNQVSKDGGFILNPILPSPLPKNELLKLYYKCGDILHRGSMKKLLSQKAPIQINYPEITALAQKLHDLLSIHFVAMLGGATVFVCVLRNSNDNDKVHIAIAERNTPPAPSA
jgi:hypothetical protein